MHTATILFAALSTLAAASPINTAKQDTTSVAPAFPMGSGSSSPQADPPKPPGVPLPTAVPRPHTIGTAPCPSNGKLVCNGPDQWGLCNWNQVQFQHVAAGTQCLNGEIVFATGFGTNA